MAAEVDLFVTRADNYGALVHCTATGRTATIDVPEADPVLARAKTRGWTITDILVTHAHFDHVEGIPAVKAATGARVVAHALDREKVPMVDQTVVEGDTVMVGSLAARVIATPGHCRDHIVYHFAADRLLFAGDVVFSLGCGRVFDSMETMWASLQKIMALPPETVVYCGHEYTASNARFALAVDPDNEALKVRAAEVTAQVGAGKPTIPTSLAQELATNPFLRAADPGIAARLGLARKPASAVFAELRERKNKF